MDSVEVREFVAEISQQNKSEIEVSWQTNSKADANAFVLKRKLTHENDFSQVTEISVQNGQSGVSGYTYRFVDRNVFKQNKSSEPVIYALYLKNSRSLTFVSQTNVNVTTTTVRKTWGSIKAMFQ